MTRLRFAVLTLAVLVSGWMVGPAVGQDLNTLLVGFLSDLRAGTFSIGAGKDVVLSSDGDGAFTVTGAGNGSDEALTVNLDDTSNVAAVSSSTGVTAIQTESGMGLGLGGPLTVSVAPVLRTTTAGGRHAYFGKSGDAIGRVGIEDDGTTGQLFFSRDGAGRNVTLSADGNSDLTTDAGVNFTATARLGSGATVTVDGATTFGVSSSVQTLACTDAETINTITGGLTGMVVWLIHTDSDCTLADDDSPTAANAIDLTGSGNDVGAAGKVIGLLYNGTHWLQTFESDN